MTKLLVAVRTEKCYIWPLVRIEHICLVLATGLELFSCRQLKSNAIMRKFHDKVDKPFSLAAAQKPMINDFLSNKQQMMLLIVRFWMRPPLAEKEEKSRSGRVALVALSLQNHSKFANTMPQMINKSRHGSLVEMKLFRSLANVNICTAQHGQPNIDFIMSFYRKTVYHQTTSRTSNTIASEWVWNRNPRWNAVHLVKQQKNARSLSHKCSPKNKYFAVIWRCVYEALPMSQKLVTIYSR